MNDKFKHSLAIHICAFICWLLPNIIWASVEVDGIYYDLNTTAKTAAVSSNPEKYTGAVDIPSSFVYNGSTYNVKSIGSRAFLSCSEMTSINFPSSVTTIGSSAFERCTGLTDVVIGSGVTFIDYEAFKNCSNLRSLTLPSSLNTIENESFSGCTSLAEIIAKRTTPPTIVSTSFNGVDKTACIVYVPEGCQSTYANATNWKTFSNIVELTVVATGPCGSNVTYTIYSDKTMVISGNGSMWDPLTWYYAIGTLDDFNKFYNDRQNVLKIIIEDGVTGIGEEALFGSHSMTSLTIPPSMTYIGKNAFSDCFNLTSVYISDLTAWCNLTFDGSESNPFSYAHHLYLNGVEIKELVIPDEISSIKPYAFFGCNGLNSLTIPNSVTSIGSNAFWRCTGLTSLTIPISVTSIGSGAFSYCTSLTSLTIPSGLTSFSNDAFYGCTSINSISVDSNNETYDSRDNCNAIIETSSNTLLYGCMNTIIPSSVIRIGDYAFFDCTGLPSAEIPSSVTSIGEGAFYGCSGLMSVTIPKSVTYIDGSAFNDCTGLCSITVESEIPISFGYDIFENVNKSTCTLYVPIGRKAEYENAEYWCEFDNIVENTSGLDVLATGSCGDNVIYTIYSGMTMVVSGTGAIKDYGFFTHINNNFYQSIKRVIIEDGVTSIGKYTFFDCTSLSTITIPNSVTSIGYSAFEDCTSLTSINIPNSVTSIGGFAFFNSAWYNNLPNGLIYINDIAYTYKGEMQEGTAITLRNGTVGIAAYAFSGCDGLISMEIPNSVTSIGEYAFSGSTGLTTITIPNSVTTIGECAFWDCISLASVTFPEGVFIIGYKAFEETAWLNNQPYGLVYAGNVVYTYKEDYDISRNLVIKEGTLGIMPDVFLKDIGYLHEDDEVLSIASISLPSSLVYLQPLLYYGASGDVYFLRRCLLSSLNVGAISVDANNPVFDSRDNCNAIIETSTNKLIVGSKSTIIPNGVTTIGAFTLGQLTTATIPSSVNLIEDCAFCPEFYHRELKEDLINTEREELLDLLGDWYVSSPIETIRMEGKIPPSAAFTSVNTSSCVLYVPAGSKSTYENAEGWCDFQNIVEYNPDTDISSLDNAIYVEQTEGRIGGTKNILVKMKNDFDVRGFQFTMELPEGTTINSWTLNQGRMPAGTTMNKVFATEGIDENKINVVCALNDGEKTFTGNDGTIATVNVSFGEGMEEGTYPIYLTNNSISDATAEYQLELSDIKSTLVLEDYVIGDTNGDGKVLVGDVIAILNYIVGSPSTNFNAKAADVNGDGKILVGDVIAVLNIIVNQ